MTPIEVGEARLALKERTKALARPLVAGRTGDPVLRGFQTASAARFVGIVTSIDTKSPQAVMHDLEVEVAALLASGMALYEYLKVAAHTQEKEQPDAPL